MSADPFTRWLRSVALLVSDRRWSAPLAAGALGFGLFAGVAIGPGAVSSVAGAGPEVIELILPGDGGDDDEPGAASGPTTADGSGALPPPALQGPVLNTPPTVLPSSAPPPLPSPLPSEDPAEPEDPGPPQPEPPAPDPPSEEPTVPSNPEPFTVSGAVAHVNPVAGIYALAASDGELTSVLARELPRPGSQLKVPVQTLESGTFAEDGKRRSQGRSNVMKVTGIVTWRDPSQSVYTLSWRGVSALIHVPPPAGDDERATLPKIGAEARVLVDLRLSPADSEGDPWEGSEEEPVVAPAPDEEPGGTNDSGGAPVANSEDPASRVEGEAEERAAEGACAPDPEDLPRPVEPLAELWQRSVKVVGPPFTYFDLTGIVQANCRGKRQIVISADDIREGGQDITLEVPEALDARPYEVGEAIGLTVITERNGVLTLTGLDSLDGIKAADDPQQSDGDLER